MVMIKTYRNSALEAFATTGATRKLPVQNAKRLGQIIALLQVAAKPMDMNLPGLVFHSLAPGQPGRFSVRVTGNYRVTFAFQDGDAVDVDLEDYH